MNDPISERIERRQRAELQLLANLRHQLPQLRALLDDCSSHWGYEDPIYRFYHQSFKVYGLQSQTLKIVDALRGLLPESSLNPWFGEIVSAGTGRVFQMEDNDHWLAVTRPIVEAFFHARYFLEMAVRYGDEFTEPPTVLPSGWASVLYLYNIR